MSRITFSEKELNDLLANNPKIKVASAEKTIKISLEDKIKKKKGSTTVNQINSYNKEASYEVTYSAEHFSILFKGARLLTINQIFAMLQIEGKKYQVFSYKKCWHSIVKDILSLYPDLPYFDDKVEITVFRQAPRLVDEDAVGIMFKFIIDALKKNKDNPNGIMAEDNPKIVKGIIPHSEKGEYCVGIKVKKITNNKGVYLPQDILSSF